EPLVHPLDERPLGGGALDQRELQPHLLQLIVARPAEPVLAVARRRERRGRPPGGPGPGAAPRVGEGSTPPGPVPPGPPRARRALCVPQSIVWRSTAIPISRSFWAVTTAWAWAIWVSAGSSTTTFSPL